MAVAACGTAGAASGGARGHTSRGLSAQLSSAKSLAAVVDRPLPGRNLYRLTDQLKLHSRTPIRKVVRTTSPNYPVGHQSSFRVLSEDSNNYFTLHATIRAETPHFYVYVQNGIKVNRAALNRAAHTFEYHIYPTDRSVYGSEWRPGVDGDPHITCLIGNLKSSITAGAFSAEDEYPPAVFPYTNAREMFYINTNTMPGDGTFDQTLAHEFQHMIHFHMHPRDSGWMNEGMSELAEHINGYSLNGEPESFVGDPGTQLDTWDTNPYSDNFNHYGAAYLYMSYLYTHFGRGMIRDLVAEKQYTDFDLVNHVLRQRHIGLTADDVFARWVVANWLNDPSVAHGIYAYPELPKTIKHATSEDGSFSLNAALTPFTAKYVVITPASGPSTSRSRRLPPPRRTPFRITAPSGGADAAT